MSITHDVPMSDYLAMPALSSGAAFRAVSQSPLHAKYYQTRPDENSKVADIGSIAHRILLEGHEDDIVLIEAEDWRTNAAKAARDEAYAADMIPLLYKQIGGIRKMVDAARAFIATSEIAGIFENGKPEVTADWIDNGVKCKARPDYLTADWHISVKTTAAVAAPGPWARRQLSPMGYDFSLMFYERGLLANEISVEHRILVIEQQPPYGCCLFALAPNKKAIAAADVERSINIWKECEATGYYPGYATETHFAEATAYELAEAEERELIEMVGA